MRIFLALAVLVYTGVSAAGNSKLDNQVSVTKPLTYLAAKSIDTLLPDLSGSFNGWDPSTRLEYEATQFTPAAPCSILGILHGVTSQSSGVSKQCSLFVWSDAGGSPGSILFGTAYTATSTSITPLWNWTGVQVSPPIYVTGAFWAGNKEWLQADPTTAFDMVSSLPVKYSVGSGWADDPYDYCHGVIVSYPSTGVPQIAASPIPLNMRIFPSSKSKSAPCFTPAKPLAENNPEYWDDIVPGEIIIGYNNKVNALTATYKELGIESKGVLSVRRNMGKDFILIKINGGIEEEKTFINSMKSNPNITSISPNRTGKLEFTPNDTWYGTYQWDKVNMNCPAAWDYGLGNTNTAIGILDCGIDYSHEDLVDRFTTTKGYDYISNDNDPAPGSGEEHGTGCAGVAAATINNSKGIAGVANARLYALRVATTTPTVAAVASGIQWCIDNNVKIISMSLSFSSNEAVLETKCNAAQSAGYILFAASGNDGLETIRYPAGYPSVIAVGSINKTNTRSSFSNYGNHIEIVAPGGTNSGTATDDIACPTPGNQYKTGWGTSLATPNTAGAAALVWSARPNLTNTELKNILTGTATDLGTAGWDKEYGYGKVNVQAAVLATGTTDEDIVNIQNLSAATGNLDVSNITYHSSWIISVSPVTFTLAPGNSQNVRVVVHDNLAAGTYYDTLFVTSNDPDNNPFLIPVVLAVTTAIEENPAITAQKLNFRTSPTVANKSLTISFNIPTARNISLKLYDATGSLVKTIADESKFSGNYNSTINTSDLSSGIYFVSLKAGDSRISKKITLIR